MMDKQTLLIFSCYTIVIILLFNFTLQQHTSSFPQNVQTTAQDPTVVTYQVATLPVTAPPPKFNPEPTLPFVEKNPVFANVSCALIKTTNFFQPGCTTSKPRKLWPLLITGTPRSGTVESHIELMAAGVRVSNDWGPPGVDGTVSWMMAFLDLRPYGPGRTGGGLFQAGIHLVRNPLHAVASMCTEPMQDSLYVYFLKRHITLDRSGHQLVDSVFARVQFWVNWNSFIDQLHLPVVRAEANDRLSQFLTFAHQQHVLLDIDIPDIFAEEIIEPDPDQPRPPKNATDADSLAHNHRPHRPYLLWTEVCSMSIPYGKKMWDMAASYGYTYEETWDEVLQHCEPVADMSCHLYR